MLHSFVCEQCGSEFQRKWLKAKFCSRECQRQWQLSVTWEDRIGKEKANRIRKKRSIQVSGDNNPTKNPDVAKKVSKSLKRHLEEYDRSGDRNPFYGKHHTDEFKQRQSENKKGAWAYNEEQYKRLCERTPKGKDHPLWRGGCSKHPYAIGFTKLLKESVKESFDKKCIICDEAGKKLVIHHIDYNKNNHSIENLIPLCIVCHGKTNYHRESWIVFFEQLLKEIKK